MRVLEKISSRIDRHNILLEKRFQLDEPGSLQQQSKKRDTRPTYQLITGFIYVPAEPTLITTKLGSGVSVCLFDPQNWIGGMNHFELPYTGSKDKATARYGNVALKNLLIMMQRAGARISSLHAQIYGGAFNPQYSTDDIGLENFRIAKSVLDKNGISVIAFDIGGWYGRNLCFNTTTGACSVSTAYDLPQDGWYPYDKA